MIRKNNPMQLQFFSRYEDLLSSMALETLSKGWQGVFRRTVLALLPVECLEKKFSATYGRPTKELYSVCGLLLMMEYFNWTMETATLNYMVDLGVQYALNIESNQTELSERTLYRYIKFLRDEDFAQDAMVRITDQLIKELQIDIREQRLDSTHVFSNMAVWSRKKLLYKIIQRFLKQVKRHAQSEYKSLDSSLTERYTNNSGWIFGETSPMGLNRGGKVYTTEEQMGYDIEKLMNHFSSNNAFTNMTSYKDMVRVFEEQFTINNGKAELSKHPGGKILLNPSDREAEIGHKGVGYQVQIVETCSENNEVQLITSAIPQGGSASDMASLPEVIENLAGANLTPEKLYADAGYGSDANYVYAAKEEVELVSPTSSKPKDKVGLDESEFDKSNRMVKCPSGKCPMFSEYKNGKGRAGFHINTCNKCSLKDQCRSQKRGKQNRFFEYTDADLRTIARRKEESTQEFKKDYGSKRTPIEGLNGRLKQFTQLRRLRVRGGPQVFHTIRAILTMHNIMQMVRYAQIKGKKGSIGVILSIFGGKKYCFIPKIAFLGFWRSQKSIYGSHTRFLRHVNNFAA